MGHNSHLLMHSFTHLLFPAKVMMNTINKVPILLEVRLFSVQQTIITYKLIEFKRGGTDTDWGSSSGKTSLKKQQRS